MTANIKKLMWKSAMAVLSISAITPNLSAAVALSITEDRVTEKFTVNDPSSMIDSLSSTDHNIVILLKSGFDLSRDGIYSFPESDNNGINALTFIQRVAFWLPTINIASDITLNPYYSQYVSYPKYDNSVHIVNSATRADLGSITFGYSAVPEPSTYIAGLSALGMLGLFGWRNRK